MGDEWGIAEGWGVAEFVAPGGGEDFVGVGGCGDEVGAIDGDPLAAVGGLVGAEPVEFVGAGGHVSTPS